MTNRMPTNPGVFSEVEEEFFRAGAMLAQAVEPQDTFADLDDGYRSISLWRRLFKGSPAPRQST
jgi:hypothetical protein